MLFLFFFQAADGIRDSPVTGVQTCALPICVHQEIYAHYGHAYDMHQNNFGMLRDFNLPLLDTVVPARIGDPQELGHLETTLVNDVGDLGSGRSSSSVIV